ncbi:hypothetical protein HD806DRAFT_546613 [Xylariaceae sp. AK1471]|nr:hypothetical protein HD806DRAFT_546613 [Xylariaceae sp. AK1471]
MEDRSSSLLNSASSRYSVLTGVWTNWSQGGIFGATLTLDRSDGGLLIAFTAFFITLVASRFWRIACLLLHRFKSTPEPQDPIYHQQQAILRNSASADSGLWRLTQLYWAWRSHGHAKRSLRRILPTIVFAIFCVGVFTVASGFSSQISTASSKGVRVAGRNCGFLDTSSTNGSVDIVGTWEAIKLTNAANYAQQCYSSADGLTLGVLDCSFFVTKNLNFTIDNTAACPFKNDICRSNNTNLLLDTGYITSDLHLGSNASPANSIRIRNVLHCAPLKTEGYTTTRSTSTLNYTRYHYGERYHNTVNISTANYTLEVEDTQSQYINAENLGSGQYNLHSILASTFNHVSSPYGSNWNASEDLVRSDGDVILNFLSGNGVLATAPITDPWYRMNVSGPSLKQLSTSQKLQTYMPEEAASPLGCVQQFQICNLTQCGPLASLADAWNDAAGIFNVNDSLIDSAIDELLDKYSSSGDEMATRFLWFANTQSTYPLTPFEVIVVLGPLILESRKKLESGLQGAIPNTQWQQDVVSWFQTTLASLQTSAVDVAYGFMDPALASFSKRVSAHIQKSICDNQARSSIPMIINSTQYTSFSLLGLYTIYITGIITILTSFVLEPILSCFQRRRKYKTYTQMEWVTNETLQLQRLGQETAGWGTWSNCVDSIPKTTSADALSSLDLSDTSHPRLQVAKQNDPVEEAGQSDGNAESVGGNTARSFRSDIVSLPPRLSLNLPCDGAEAVAEFTVNRIPTNDRRDGDIG